MSTQYNSTTYNAVKQKLQQFHLPLNNNESTNKHHNRVDHHNNDTIDQLELQQNTDSATVSTTQSQESLYELDSQYNILINKVNELLHKYGLAYTADTILQPVYNKFRSIYTSVYNELHRSHHTAINELSHLQSNNNIIKHEYDNKLRQLQSQHNTALKHIESQVERKYIDKMQSLEKSNRRAADMREHIKRELRVELEQTINNEYNTSITIQINELRESAGKMLQQKQSEINELRHANVQLNDQYNGLHSQLETLQQLYDRILQQSQRDQNLVTQHVNQISVLNNNIHEYQQQCIDLNNTITQLQQQMVLSDQQHLTELHTIDNKIQGIVNKKDNQIASIQLQLQQSIQSNQQLQDELEQARLELHQML